MPLNYLRQTWQLAGVLLLSATHESYAAINVVVDHTANAEARARVSFSRVPPPSSSDVAASARLKIVSGRADPNSGEPQVLQDGKFPAEEDQPGANFFFDAGTAGGSIVIDLGKAIELKRLNSYSWHSNSRAPQVYKVYGADGAGASFKREPGPNDDLEKSGWKLIAEVDTRPKQGNSGGQYGVSISAAEGAIGTYQYLLYVISRTEDSDTFGNTFYSEIDVIDINETSVVQSTNQPVIDIIVTRDGHEISIDTSETPDLTEWTRAKVATMAKEWYPKIIDLLPSEGYEAPKKVSIVFDDDMRGVAATSGTRIRCAASWFRRNLEGEAVGAIFHELVHVVQQYGRARRQNPDAPRTPGWLTEGIPDYLRWFIYEPQTRGAEITRRNISRARYDASYRISANFLNWATEKYAKDLVKVLNAAIREGKYAEDLWKERSGHTLHELGDEWRKEVEAKVERESSSAD